MSTHHARLEPVGGPVLTKPFIALGALAVLTVVLVLWRFVVGLGPATALTDGYPWGAWKIFNVIVLTALASGGYAIAILVYALNRGQYHAVARTAILTSALGYTTGVVALGVDIGRPWNFYRLAAVWTWNLHSVLLEVAVCISTYLIFLWLELSPPFLEEWRRGPEGRLKKLATWVTPKLEAAFPFVIAAAITLPSMHQSSLGSLFLLSGPRIHPLWQTPLLPGFFLLSCWFLGFACVVIVSLLSSLAWSRPLETKILSSLARVMGWVMLVFVAGRFVDVIVRGQLARAFEPNVYALMFWAEALLLAVPAALILFGRAQSEDAGRLLRLAAVVAVGGALYRLDAALIGFMPGDNMRYFPSVTELVITLGFMGMAVMGYLFAVKRFPILPAAEPRTRRV